jgi:hypothetical protein
MIASSEQTVNKVRIRNTEYSSQETVIGGAEPPPYILFTISYSYPLNFMFIYKSVEQGRPAAGGFV